VYCVVKRIKVAVIWNKTFRVSPFPKTQYCSFKYGTKRSCSVHVLVDATYTQRSALGTDLGAHTGSGGGGDSGGGGGGGGDGDGGGGGGRDLLPPTIAGVSPLGAFDQCHD
jgi:hypothetical protein